jgi:hypothetical protein
MYQNVVWWFEIDFYSLVEKESQVLRGFGGSDYRLFPISDINN